MKSWYLRRGWILPLTLALFVDNLRGTPVRSAAVLTALLWAAAVFVAFRRRPGCSFILPTFLAWLLAGVSFSCFRANTLNEWSLLVGAAALAAGFSVLLEVVPGERDVLPPVLLGLGLAKAVLAWFTPHFLNANLSLVGMFISLALIVGRPRRIDRAAIPWFLLAAAALPLMKRWGMSSAVMGLFVGLLISEGFRRRRRMFFGAAGAIGILLTVLFVAGPRGFRDNPDDPRRLNRLTMWRDSAVYAVHEGIVGTGLGTFEQYYPRFKTMPELDTANYAHNEFLQILCEGGILGGLLVLMLLLVLGRAAVRRGWESPEPAAGLAAIGLWSMLYYPLHWEAILFVGALLTADVVRHPSRQWSPASVTVSVGAVLLAATVALTQGVSGLWEFSGGQAWKADRIEEALGRFRTAARWNPLEPRLLDHQVECLRRMDRKPETLPLLEKAAALKPRDVWLRRKLAVAKLNLVGREAARETYAPILDLTPNVAQFRREYDELKTKK